MRSSPSASTQSRRPRETPPPVARRSTPNNPPCVRSFPWPPPRRSARPTSAAPRLVHTSSARIMLRTSIAAVPSHHACSVAYRSASGTSVRNPSDPRFTLSSGTFVCANARAAANNVPSPPSTTARSGLRAGIFARANPSPSERYAALSWSRRQLHPRSASQARSSGRIVSSSAFCGFEIIAANDILPTSVPPEPLQSPNSDRHRPSPIQSAAGSQTKKIAPIRVHRCRAPRLVKPHAADKRTTSRFFCALRKLRAYHSGRAGVALKELSR